MTDPAEAAKNTVELGKKHIRDQQDPAFVVGQMRGNFNK
jgi:hypothetical protein